MSSRERGLKKIRLGIEGKYFKLPRLSKAAVSYSPLLSNLESERKE